MANEGTSNGSGRFCAPLRSRRKRALTTLIGAVTLLALAASSSTPLGAEEKPSDKLLFLVARPAILDPVFEKSVVLMLPIEGEPVIVGLIINKPTRLTLTKLFPDSPTLKNSTDDAYLGGPVDMASPALIFHSAKPPKHAMLLYDDVYLSFDTKFISKVLVDPKASGEVRLFLGRAQWAPAQLQGEALEGSWYSLRAEGAVIFDRDSANLWKRLHDRARPPANIEYHMPPHPWEKHFGLEVNFLPRWLPEVPDANFPARGFLAN